MKKNKIDVIIGYGKLLPGKKVMVQSENEEKEVSAEHVIIATGARARELTNLKPDGKKIIEYRKAMTLEKQPKKMVIVGSGAIGVGFAYFYNAMGTEVPIVEYPPRIVPVEDEDISKQMEKIFVKSGIKVLTSSEVKEVQENGITLKVIIEKDGKSSDIDADVVLSAVGIKANIENIGLVELGVNVENDKIVVDSFYNTNVPGYYAIGDVTGGQSLAHVASAEGIICVEKIAGLDVDKLDYENIPGCTYSQPEIASVGLTELQAKEKGYELKVGKFPFTASGKAQASGTPDGFIKVIFDAKYGEWLGCHMIGSGVTDMIAEAVLGRKLETTGHEVLKSVHPHPTMSEAVMEAVADAYGEVIHL